MKLLRCEINGFRSLREFGVTLPEFAVLLGENNCGKSNVLSALELFLSSSIRGLSREDFFGFDEGGKISIKCTFIDLSDSEMEKLRPWTVGGTLTVKKTYSLDPTGKPAVEYLALMRVPAAPWLRDDYDAYSDRATIQALPIYQHLPPSGRITKAQYQGAVSDYIRAGRDSIDYVVEERPNPAGFKQVLDGYLPELFLMPAIKEASEETRADPKGYFGRILGAITQRIAGENRHFKKLVEAADELRRAIQGEPPNEKIAEIKHLEDAIQGELSAWNVGVSIGVEPTDPEQLLRLKARMILDDGVPTSVDAKGHGLQRSVIFALLRVWSKIERSQVDGAGREGRRRSVIWAFEEPELYLHPQVCRATYDALRNIATHEQVVVCTHSPNFVRMEDYKSLILIRKPSREDGSRPVQVSADIFTTASEDKKNFDMIRFFSPDRSELFFARKAVLVEGAIDKLSLAATASRLGFFKHDVTVVDCGGKTNLQLYMRVLNAFEIPYLAIYDEDPITEDEKPGGPRHVPAKYVHAKRMFDENATIEAKRSIPCGQTKMVSPSFEAILGRSSPFSAVSFLSDPSNPIPSEVEGLARAAYD
jgi:putative ATP-dependent endonuclease of OLD family